MSDGAKLLKGILAPFRGLVIIFSSFRLILYAAIPFWICMFIGIFGMMSLWGQTQPLGELIVNWFPWTQALVDYTSVMEFSVLGFLLKLFFWLFVIIFFAYFSYLLLAIVGAPFYSLMAEKVLISSGAKPFEASGIGHWAKTTIRMFLISCIKLLFFMLLTFGLLVMSFFPILMVLVPILMCAMVAYDCMDFSFECMTMNFSERIAFFQKHLPAFIGLAIIILCVGILPGLFTLLLPFFIAGCAELFSQLKRTT